MATRSNLDAGASNARAGTSPNTPPNVRVSTGVNRRAPDRSSGWFGIGIFLFILLLGLIFFVLASGTLRHRYFNREPPPGNAPTAPGPVIAH